MEQKTKTFAELYESQGHYMDAMNIYIDLLKENPLDIELPDKIRKLQSLISEEKNKKKKIIEAKLTALDSLLDKFISYKAAGL